MKNAALITLSLILLSSCSSIGNNKNTKISIPNDIVNGECEKKQDDLLGASGKDIFMWTNSLIDKIESCRQEKSGIIKIVNEYNTR